MDISDVTSSSRAAALVARSFAEADERSLGPDVFSRVDLAARAREDASVGSARDRSRDPRLALLCIGVRLRSSLVDPHRSRGGGCPEDRSHDLETERVTAFPRGLTGACLTRRFTRVRARRARPPPFAPHGAASPASPRGAASPSSPEVSLTRCLSTLSGFTMFEDDASGRSDVLRRIYRVAWGATRRQPRSIRPMSAAHGFSFQR